MAFRILPALVLAVACVADAAAQVPRIPGRVEKVVLYRGQALVTRVIRLEGPAGNQEVIVTGLPEQIVPTSLYAESADGVDVRAVRFRAIASSEEPREDVRAIDQKLLDLAEKISVNARKQELATRHLQSLDALDKFVAPTAQAELTKGVLNAETLERLVTFAFEQRKKAAEELLGLAKEAKDIEKEVQLLNRQRTEITSGTNKTLREAVLFLERRHAEPAAVRLVYLVNNCGWSPSYNLRSTGELAEVEAEYNANIQQMSGEDWSEVEITLSTATPALNSSGPALAPFLVELRPGMPAQAPEDQTVSLGRFKEIQNRRQIAQYENLNAITNPTNFQTAWAVNEAAVACQTFELLEGRDVVLTALSTMGADAQGPSLAYPLAPRVSLQSRPDQQLVRIATVKLRGRGYHMAAPVLTGLVYREAEMTNSGEIDLLGGPMSVYLDGRFVGRGEMESVARGQSFVVGFGADPQIRTRREQVDKADRVQGGNKMIEIKYRLVVENFKSAPVALRLLDRLPHSERTQELRVTLGKTSAELSTDSAYVRLEKPRGVLRWDVQVPASATGEKTFTVEYAYTLEHDRNLALGAPAPEQQQKAQADFENLLKQKAGK